MTTNNHPANSPVSLERLHQIRETLSKAAAQSDGGNIGYAMADAVKVIDGAIASFGTEPVAWLLSGGGAKNHVSFDSGNAYADPLREVTPLYTASPAPVSVPAAMEMDDDFDSAFEHGKAVGWNAYRAAMLQGADPVQAWIPCSERMPDTMISVLVTGDWFRHAVSFWDGASWCDLDFEPPVTHWQPLPAAPQQESKP